MIRAARVNRDFFPNPTLSQSAPVGSTGGDQKFSFRCGNAEDMARSGILDNSVDLVIAGRSHGFFFHTFVHVNLATIFRMGHEILFPHQFM